MSARNICTKMSELLADFKPGPLDYYRNKTSFNWKKLKVFLEGEEIVRYQNEVHRILENNPEYRNNLLTYSFDEGRRIASRRSFVHKSLECLSLENMLMDLKRPAAMLRIMMQISPSSSIKYSVGNGLFVNVLRTLGTDRHQPFIDASDDGEIHGCYCLTEIGHGSNVRGMKTTATYDRATEQFVMHSPDFESAKCWAGALGQSATHAIVYAQLVIEGKSYGLHTFVVELRSPKTLIPHAGVIVGDMGEKIGLNGVDNGFLMFDNYHIPRENLLNKLGDVTSEGQYLTPFKDPSKRHGASLGALSIGRVNITTIIEAYGTKALTIAIRYAAIRKQFGPDNEPEIPILEYQSHQYRLLPYLAATYVLRVFGSYLVEVQYQFSVDSALGNNSEVLPDLGMELHAVSSACKPLAGWIMKDGIQECRESCGGHGYLKAAGIGDIRNDNDANLTYEGENHVLIQQTSNWLLKLWPVILKRGRISSPLHSIDFLSNGLDILGSKFKANSVEEMCHPEEIMSIYQWLIVYLLERTSDKLQANLKSGKSAFWARNDNQVFYAKNLSTAYIQHFFLQRMLIMINQAEDPSIKAVLSKLFALYGLWSLEKHLPTLYQGEYAKGPKITTLVQDAILQLCSDLKNDSVALIDAIAPPDFILNSVLGASDGQVYKHLRSAIFRSPYAMSRPDWWQEIVDWKSKVLNNKL